MPPKRSTSEKVKNFFSRPFRRASSTSKGRPTISDPDPFFSQNQIRPQDVQTLQDVRNQKRPANVTSTSGYRPPSQDARQHRSNRSFGERMRSDLRAGIDETSAALMGDAPIPDRRRGRETTPFRVAAPTPAHLGDSRTARRQEREPPRPVPISAPIAPANLADSVQVDTRNRNAEREPERQRQRERNFHQVPETIQTVPARRIQLNPPPARESVHVQVSGSPSSSTSSRSTRWDDFAGPPTTLAPPPLPALPAPNPGPLRQVPIPVRRQPRVPVRRRPATPPPLCRLCGNQPVSAQGSTLCAYCTSIAFYPEDYPRSSTYPSKTPLLPPVAHLKDSSYTRSRRRSQTQAQTTTPLTRSDSLQRTPATHLRPTRAQSQSHRLSRPAPHDPNPYTLSPLPTDAPSIHPALRRSSHRFPFQPDSRHESVVSGTPTTAGFHAQLAGGYEPRVPGTPERRRRGAVSGVWERTWEEGPEAGPEVPAKEGGGGWGEGEGEGAWMGMGRRW